jgi:hypothetical protein
MPVSLSLDTSTSNVFASMGNGDGFEWSPEGVTFGIDFTTDRVFDGTTVTDDYSTVLGGDFDAGDVSALGMALFDSGHSPIAVGDLLTKLATLDYTIVFFWRQAQLLADDYLLALQDVDETNQAEIYYGSGELYASARAGSYLPVGTVRAFSDNVLATSHGPAGWLSSLNGETAVLDDTATVAVIVLAAIGNSGNGDWLEGWLKAMVFYDATDAAGVEAYSANAAPVNTVAPTITGTAQVGQVLSVSTGTWTGAPTSYQYQWYRDNFNGSSAVDGATASTFTPTVAELGVTMKCVVYALNADGISGIGVSDDETVIAA